MISAENITKYFGSFRALHNVSFEIGQGDIIGFLGKNGAGKTTLMRILTSYLPANDGKVCVGGDDIRKHSLKIRKSIGYLPENPPLYPAMTIQDYLRFAAQMKDVPAKQQTLQVEKVMGDCGLARARHKKISHLSKGYKQRVGIAQAIINDPQLLILDEPTSGLDPVQILQVRQLIKDLEHKRTVILSTHILPEIEQIARRVLILREGEICVDETMDNLLKEHKTLEGAFLNLHSHE